MGNRPHKKGKNYKTRDYGNYLKIRDIARILQINKGSLDAVIRRLKIESLRDIIGTSDIRQQHRLFKQSDLRPIAEEYYGPIASHEFMYYCPHCHKPVKMTLYRLLMLQEEERLKKDRKSGIMYRIENEMNERKEL